MRNEVIGWLSSAILLSTIVKQIHEQWRKGTSKGVSPFLFLGQLAASTGFLIYSALVRSPVFLVTNALMMVSAIIGLVLVMVHRRRGAAGTSRPDGEPTEAGGAKSQGAAQTFLRSSALEIGSR